MKKITDPNLINRCIQKDPLAWNEFVRQYSGLVYWAIENRLKKWDYLYYAEDIEEIYQNTFLGLWKKNALEQLKDPQKVASWLVVISGNEAIDYFKYKKAQTPPKAISIFEEISQGGGSFTLADILPSRQADPVSQATVNEIETILEKEIESFSSKEKMILKLNILYNKKYREIAQMLSMPVGTVSTSLKNTKNRLRKRLKGKI